MRSSEGGFVCLRESFYLNTVAEHPVPMLQDPSIKEMAEQIAKDPAFSQVTQQLQKSMTQSPDGNPQIDPQQYMQAMKSVMENPQFVQMAEKLGSALMSVSFGLF
jgi:hypothetical protein